MGTEMGKGETKLTYDAVLPAGGRISGVFAQKAGVTLKALISHENGTILEHTIAVLRATERIQQIIVIGPESLASNPAVRQADQVLMEGKSGAENTLIGLKWLLVRNSERKALIVTTDLPFLTSDAVNSFLDSCPENSDICIPVLTDEEMDAHFPGSANTYVHLGDELWTMGCLFLVDPRIIVSQRQRLENVFTARKSQIGMAYLLGPRFLLRYFLKTLTIADIEEKCSELFHCHGYAIRHSPPELAFDLDALEEYEYYLRF